MGVQRQLGTMDVCWWIGTAAHTGVYGTLGTGSTTNIPGSRKGAVTWTDSSGNFWLFGGVGVDSVKDESGELNDLWEYNPTTGVWTWQSGSTADQWSGSLRNARNCGSANVPELGEARRTGSMRPGISGCLAGTGPSAGQTVRSAICGSTCRKSNADQLLGNESQKPHSNVENRR